MPETKNTLDMVITKHHLTKTDIMNELQVREDYQEFLSIALMPFDNSELRAWLELQS